MKDQKQSSQVKGAGGAEGTESVSEEAHEANHSKKHHRPACQYTPEHISQDQPHFQDYYHYSGKLSPLWAQHGKVGGKIQCLLHQVHNDQVLRECNVVHLP